MKARPASASSTSRWDTTSNLCARWQRCVIAAGALLLCISAGGFAQASREEALARVYPGAAIRAERVFLTKQQIQQAAAVSEVDVPNALIARYLAIVNGKVIGRAYVDTHIVRTKNESLLICLDQSGKVKRIEVTAFLEPQEYQASPAWYGQYEGKVLENNLNLHRAIRPIAGATLTATATTRAVRRVLAIDQTLTADENTGR